MLRSLDPVTSVEAAAEYALTLGRDASKIARALEVHLLKFKSQPAVHAELHRMATVLRDFAYGIQNLEAKLPESLRLKFGTA